MAKTKVICTVCGRQGVGHPSLSFCGCPSKETEDIGLWRVEKEPVGTKRFYKPFQMWHRNFIFTLLKEEE